MASACWRASCCCLSVACIQTVSGILAVAGVASFPANPGFLILADGFVEWDILHYQTIGLRLAECNFFLLSNYQNIEYRIGEFKNLSDYWISDQGLNLSDYRTSVSEKNYRLPTSGGLVLLLRLLRLLTLNTFIWTFHSFIPISQNRLTAVVVVVVPQVPGDALLSV